MSEEKMSLGTMLRFMALVVLFGCLIIALLARMEKLERELDRYKNAPADTVEVVRFDTITITEPKIEYRYISKTEYVPIVKDSLITDTIKELVYLPREYMVYKDTSYRAVVSGVEPRLDSIEIYQKNTTQTVTKYVQVPDKKRWGLGIGVGAGFNGKEIQPYVGIGVQYNIIRW